MVAQRRSRKLTALEVRALLRYDRKLGKLYWKISPATNVRAGSEAGTTLKIGKSCYRVVWILGKQYYAHRLIWLIVRGQWPKYEVDHEDHNGLNNRIRNLKDVTHVGNSRNRPLECRNRSGYHGVRWCSKRRQWRSQIKGWQRWFDELKDAVAARKLAERRLGFHSNHGGAR